MLEDPFDDLHVTLNRVLQVLSGTLDLQRVSFWKFVDDDALRRTHHYQRVSTAPGGPDLLRRDEFPNYFAAVKSELTIAASDAASDPRTSDLNETYLAPLGITSLLDVPVRVFGRQIGVLCHEHQGPPRRWTAEDQHFASGVATQVALAHERHHARRLQMEVLARTLHDEETRLPNRVFVERAMAEARDRGEPAGLATLSLDRFASIQAALGTAQGRTLLQRVADRLADARNGGAVVARVGPAEFALLVTGRPEDQFAALSSSWVTSAAAPVRVGDRQFFLTSSAGLAYRSRLEGEPTDVLWEESQVAQLEARSEGGARTKAFDRAMRERLQFRAHVEQDLRRGLEGRQFSAHYQPIVDLETGEWRAVEALLRWAHPVRGLVPPGDFLPIATECGMSLDLGRGVIREACRALPQLRRDTGLPDLALSINLSAAEVLVPGTGQALLEQLAAVDVSPTAVTIEVTESVFMLDLERAAGALGAIRSHGVAIGLDDFGTNFSSLSWLRELPIDIVKIDRSFVAGMTRDRRDLSIVRSIVDLAHSLGLSVVAEGIESENQRSVLRGMGVEKGQGFLFSRPEPAERLWRSRLTG